MQPAVTDLHLDHEAREALNALVGLQGLGTPLWYWHNLRWQMTFDQAACIALKHLLQHSFTCSSLLNIE